MRYKSEVECYGGINGVGEICIKVGVWLICDHGEACLLTSPLLVGAIIDMIPKAPWGEALAIAIKLQAAYIRMKNEESGGKGVNLLYLFSTGVISNVKRRGKGRSACPLLPIEVPRDHISPLPVYVPSKEDLELLEGLEQMEDSSAD